MSPEGTRALFIGRFQPPHAGHLEVLRDLAGRHARLLVGIGSAFESHTERNPFSAGERFRMLEDALAEAGIGNVAIVPVPDLNRNALWVRHVESLLPPFDAFVSNNALPRRLFREAGYALEDVPLKERDRLEGWRIRDRILRDDGWEECVPPAVARVMREIGAVERVRDLARSDATR